MLRRVSIEGFTSFPGVRWRLKDPTTELTLAIQGRPQPASLRLYSSWFERRFAACFRMADGAFPQGWLVNPEADPLAVHLAAGITALQRLALQEVRRAQVLEANAERLRLALPAFNGAVLQRSIQLALQLLLELDRGGSGQGGRLAALEQAIEAFLKKAADVGGEEQLRFALAAERLGLPLVATCTGFLEIGHGCSRRLLDNSLLATAAPAASLASDKIATYLVLQRAGLPVPASRIVNTEADLLPAAEALGWPLVVKPMDQSLQQGVTTGVSDRITLEAAYRVARNVSAGSVLVQQQVEGIELRMLVLGASRVVARRSDFGFLIGDGQSTVEALARAAIASLQGSSAKEDSIEGLPVLKSVAENILGEKNLTTESIPDVGQRIRLSHAMVRWLGGLKTDFTDLLHPSYGELARRVARVLQLDVAGLDLITPDPVRPWWEVDAAILEANSRPGIYAHEHADPDLRIYEEALRHGMSETSQPLLMAAAGGELLASCWPALESALPAALPDGTALGVLRGGSCSLGGEPLPVAAEAKGQVGQALLADPRCGAALLAWEAAALAAYGRPCERLDLALLADGAEPLVLQEILDADPQIVIWIGAGQEAWADALEAWQSRDSAHHLVRLQSPAELATRLPQLLSSCAHPAGAGHAVRASAP